MGTQTRQKVNMDIRGPARRYMARRYMARRYMARMYMARRYMAGNMRVCLVGVNRMYMLLQWCLWNTERYLCKTSNKYIYIISFFQKSNLSRIVDLSLICTLYRPKSWWSIHVLKVDRYNRWLQSHHFAIQRNMYLSSMAWCNPPFSCYPDAHPASAWDL